MLTDSAAQLSLSELFDALPDNVVYYRAVRDETDSSADIQNPVVDFVIDYANPAALQITAGRYQIAVGTSLRHGNPQDRELTEQRFILLSEVLESGKPHEMEYFNPKFNQWLSLRFSKAGDGVLSVAGLSNTPAHLQQENERQQRVFERTINASLNGIISYEAVRNQAGAIVDFRAITVNHIAQQILHLSDTEPGWLILDRFPGVQERGIFDQYVELVETGESQRFETPYANESFSGWYDVSVVKLDDGFVITFNDITAQKEVTAENERQRQLLDSVFNTPLNTIFVYQAVRDNAGVIQDFAVRLVNERGRTDVLNRLNIDVVGKTLLQINPNSRQGGQFELFRQIIESGQPYQTEQFYPDAKSWYNTSISKLDDGVVVIGNDITAQKEISLEIEQQKSLMEAMLDGSLNGLLLLEPVYDAKLTIVDFSVLAANQAVEQLTGVSPGQAIGGRMLTVYPGIKEAGYFGMYVSVLQTGQPGRMESYYKDEQGLEGWFEVSAVRLDNTVVVTFTNTSNFRQAEQELKQASNELQAVIDNSQTGIFVFSPVYDDAGEVVDFRFKAINKMVAALIGQTPDAIRGDLASNWFISYRDTETYTRYVTTLATGEEQRFDINYNVDGLDVWFDVRSVKLGDDVLVTFTDYTPLKQLQMAQEQQADFLDSVLNGTNNGIMAFEAVRNTQGAIIDLLITSTNSVGAGIAGKTIDGLVGKRALADFPGIQPTGLYDLYVCTIETSEPGQKELHYQADGLDVFVDVKTSPLGDGLVVTYNDVTAARQLSLQIEQQANLLNNVLDGSQNGIMSFEAIRDGAGQIQDFCFLTVNEAASRMVGKTAEEVVGKKLLSVFPGNVESGLFAKYVHTTNTHKPTQTEVYYKADELDFWLDISARKLADGFVVTFTDTSLIKRASLLVEQSAAELQTVIDTAQTGIFLIDPVCDDADEVVDFRFRVANKMLAEYVGQESTQAAGVLASVWFPDYQANGLFNLYKHTYQTGEQQRFDFHYEGGGVDAWLDIMATKVNDEVLVTFTDYTPLKKLQQQLEASVIDLQRSNKNLEQFAYVASHDLQEPLRKIQQFGDILQTNYASRLDEDGQIMLTRMQSAADRMRVLIKDVLAYSRITTKRENARLLDLNALIGEVLTDLETSIADKQAIVRLDLLPTILGDAVQMRQLFQNLISNALKFNKVGRQPELRLTSYTQPGHETGLFISPADQTNLFHRIELTDNGIGFDPTHADRIFQVFQRLHNRNEYAGTGIGLAIVQKVVENHQGYIVAKGRPGEGATFVILLPA